MRIGKTIWLASERWQRSILTCVGKIPVRALQDWINIGNLHDGPLSYFSRGYLAIFSFSFLDIN